MLSLEDSQRTADAVFLADHNSKATLSIVAQSETNNGDKIAS